MEREKICAIVDNKAYVFPTHIQGYVEAYMIEVLNLGNRDYCLHYETDLTDQEKIVITDLQDFLDSLPTD
jgi:hypothetical protein